MAAAEKRAEARTRYYTREEAARLGWDVRHPSRGGSFLEEQEIVDFFPKLAPALGQDKPDFVSLIDGKLSAVIECKNDWREADRAIGEAQEYADTIQSVRGYEPRLAIGVAGTPDKRVQVRCRFKRGSQWVNLESNGYPLTQIPAPAEVHLALINGNGTTDVQLPDEREFFSAAINISRILRLAKIEEAIRPKVIGAIVLALYQGNFSMDQEVVIENINTNVRAAIANRFVDVPQKRRQFLIQTLELSAESNRLRPMVVDVVHQLERLNVRSIMRSGVDFLGQFYETFLRYGQDSKKLGIVFTPRHITRFCADIVDVSLGQTVYDPACGTGGFLVAAYDRMMKQANTPLAKKRAKESIFGSDTNSTVWALAILNMFFRGDGKSSIVYGDCFEAEEDYEGRFDRSLLNPPFSQEGEPEIDFIDHALKSVKPGGRVAVVVKTSVMVDSDLRKWRASLVANHQVEAVLTMPLEMFYPTAAPTVILIVRAHAPSAKAGTFLARIENDGFEISKKRRVPIAGSQLPTVAGLFAKFERSGRVVTIPNFVTLVGRERILQGEEICAEQWLPSAAYGVEEYERHRVETMRQLSLAIANFPDVADELIGNFENLLAHGKRNGRPSGRAPLSDWFSIRNGMSSGSRNYAPGTVPYVSSGDAYNGIVEFVEPVEGETYETPVITVSAFGQAYVQPWRCCARGNGGSAVRILTPRFAMTVAELFWFVGQINAQRWRFHYGRMALPDRLNRLDVDVPPESLPAFPPLAERLRAFRRGLDSLMDLTPARERLSIAAEGDDPEDERDAEIARAQIAKIAADPNEVVGGKKLEDALAEILR